MVPYDDMPKVKFGLGRRFSYDARDKLFQMRRMLPPPTADIPIRKTWSFRGSPLNQGATGTCVAHAGVHYLHAAPMESKITIENPFTLYRKCIVEDEFPANDSEVTGPDSALQYGTSTRALMKVLQNKGHIASYVWANTLRELTEWVLLKGPVVVGTNWYDSMFTVNADGFVKIQPNARVVGGHEWMIRGTDNKKGFSRCVNSWGPGFGKDGEFYISHENLERLLHEDGDCAAAVQTKIKPLPEKAAA